MLATLLDTRIDGVQHLHDTTPVTQLIKMIALRHKIVHQVTEIIVGTCSDVLSSDANRCSHAA
jgi:hypothetical protein